MGLHVIPNDLTGLTPGERRVLEKLKTIYRNRNDVEAYLYVQPRIRNLVPDFILIDPQYGVAILEVKDWGISYIHRADRRKINLMDKKQVDNPLFKANQYFHAAQGLFSMQENLLNDQASLRFKLYSKVIFTNLTSTNIHENDLTSIFNQPPSTYITSDMLSTMNIPSIFSDVPSSLEEDEVITVRTLLYPEIKINKISPRDRKHNRELIKALDMEQERFAKRLPYGHYMVTGVPGSGKTVILLARAIHLIRQHPEWKIRILTYNKSLATKIENKINSLAAELEFMDVRLENIQISTFHKFALSIANVGVPNKPSQEWWDKELPGIAIQKARSIYDAILVDEYQDFLDDWIRLCVKACVKHTYTDNENKQVEGKNLFLAGDRLQSIYKSTEHSWKSLGMDMRGRSQLLKKSYRSGSEHIDLALKFLKENKHLAEEVDKFYCAMNELTYDNHVNDTVVFMEDTYKGISEMIKELIYKGGYNPEDILVLCNEWSDCRDIQQQFDYGLQQKSEVTKNMTEGKIVLTTYYSAKGIEAPIVLLVDTDKFKEQLVKQNNIKLRKLIYVGMTRASERLYFHASSFKSDSYGKIIHEIVTKGN